ncbi:hypothetical protein VA249_45770 (plasmid) [Vibrio alfacsensis]|uniref:PD-(D/E)XK nuclease family protein n=1 Tax=Vibrio alfacsensis TaxID=1074311 RepID=UPI001BF00396|nr:PD-(D/E)XK nuclease family protein [Vibrio alfacsensis]BBM67931.1 hypothetical protein VA249_45770 [Vibrio alfacsensis]
MSAFLKTYPLTASQFVEWGTHPTIEPRIRGIIEHYAHHQAVITYQVHTVPQPSNDESWLSNENMPTILRMANIVKSEENIEYIYRDLRLYGRIDQLYQYSGNFILVDTKSHKEPTFSDQLQLSFYAFILANIGFKVAPVAFIRSVYNSVDYEQLDLIPPEVMREIIDEVE